MRNEMQLLSQFVYASHILRSNVRRISNSQFFLPSAPTLIPFFGSDVRNKFPLTRRKWKKDVVYLYQVKQSSKAPNISPFCLKLETWLRAHGIEYQTRKITALRASNIFSAPIELNGERIAVSQIAIQRVQEHFGIHDELEGVYKGIAHAVERMIDENTHHLLLHSKFDTNMPKLIKAIEPWPVKRFFTWMLMASYKNEVDRQLKDSGLYKRSENDIMELLRKDIRALDLILGDKKFLFGFKPTIADFTLFGHLASSYYLPFRQPITSLLDNEFPRIKNLIERMRQHYYPEWKFGI